MNDTARATEDRITELIRAGQVQEAQRKLMSLRLGMRLR